MNGPKAFGFAAIFCSLTGCFGLFDNGSDYIVDNYDVTWIDLHAHRALYNSEEIIPAYVFGVGHSPKFIFVKQHPLSSEADDKIVNSVTNYYIIERTTSNSQDKPVYGPLSKKAFDLQCAKLGVREVTFDLTYPENIN